MHVYTWSNKKDKCLSFCSVCKSSVQFIRIDSLTYMFSKYSLRVCLPALLACVKWMPLRATNLLQPHHLLTSSKHEHSLLQLLVEVLHFWLKSYTYYYHDKSGQWFFRHQWVWGSQTAQLAWYVKQILEQPKVWNDWRLSLSLVVVTCGGSWCDLWTAWGCAGCSTTWRGRSLRWGWTRVWSPVPCAWPSLTSPSAPPCSRNSGFWSHWGLDSTPRPSETHNKTSLYIM